MTPKVFISYSWTNQAHQERVKDWADRLLADGINVILDIYDLKEGQDKYAFMERMVTDNDVTHVLVISDKSYAEKADAREKGVGTESQIISQEVYNKVAQSKFIPIVCEFIDDKTPCLPVFLKSRIWIDFSTPEAANGHWERLVRLLHGKPLHEKPLVGKPPAYISEESAVPSSPARAKFATFQQALLQGKPGLRKYRLDFLDACIEYADALRIRKRPDIDALPSRILEDCGKLTAVRDLLIDWILLEAEISSSEEFTEALFHLLERLRELKSRPSELNEWNDAWFEAHKLFVFECFLYIVAALLKSNAYSVLHEIYTSHYITPETERYGTDKFDNFDCFYGYSELLNSVLAPEGQKLYSPAAELIKRQAGRKDIPFSELIQADLLNLLISFITPDTRWYPQLLHYAGYAKEFPFFLRATQNKNFKKLAIVTGIDNAEVLRETVAKGQVRLDTDRWHNFHFSRNFSNALNLERLDTIK